MIASRFEHNPEGIVQLNGLKDANVLALGQQLKIPGKASSRAQEPPAAPGRPVRVEPPALLCRPATPWAELRGALTGTTVAALLKLNGLSNPDALAIGQKLKVPGAGGGAPAAVGTPRACDRGAGSGLTGSKGDTLLSIPRRSRPDHEAAPGGQQHHQP